MCDGNKHDSAPILTAEQVAAAPRKFEIGDRVIVSRRNPVDVPVGTAGVVRDIQVVPLTDSPEPFLGVEWEDFNAGHDLDGLLPAGAKNGRFIDGQDVILEGASSPAQAGEQAGDTERRINGLTESEMVQQSNKLLTKLVNEIGPFAVSLAKQEIETNKTLPAVVVLGTVADAAVMVGNTLGKLGEMVARDPQGTLAMLQRAA